MYSKKLIEVALPLEKINEECAREKSIRQGHPSTLHLWWARRPLAAARAVLWASMIDDPSSHPELFPSEEEQVKERRRLFSILESLVVWENSTNEKVLAIAKNEIRKSIGNSIPTLLDPFSGGGTIPTEGLRLGLNVEAHDLNPVALMINKAMLELPQKFKNEQPVNPSYNMLGRASGYCGASGLAADVKYYGEIVKKKAYEQIGQLYPKVYDKEKNQYLNAVAWLWTRTVKCPNPACGCEMPLIKSFELTKKSKSACYLNPVVEGKTIRYEIKNGKTKDKGTVNRKGATCLFCGSPVSLDYIREKGQSNELGYQLLAVIAEGPKGKVYLPASADNSPSGISRPEQYPDTEIAYYPGCTNCKIYGMDYFNDLMTNRQLTAMVVFSDIVTGIVDIIKEDAASQGIELKDGYPEAVRTYLAFGVDRLATRLTKVCLWNTTAETIEQPFGRQAIPMVWTFPEANVFSNSTGGWSSSLEWIPKVLDCMFVSDNQGNVKQEDAMEFVSENKYLVSTDPPYYSNVPYADLSDFFYIWLRKMVRDDYPELFATINTPKANELVAEKYRCGGDDEKAKAFFENGMYKTFCNVKQYVNEDFPLTIYYAFKQADNDEDDEIASSGWETMLSALIRSGFVITGTWPIRTERTSGLKNSLNALGTSIVLVCRKRPENASTITRRNFISILKKELSDSLKELQSSNIAPVDMAQSTIGPGMAVYSKYNKVLEADGSEMTVRSALQIINNELDLYFNNQDGELDRESRFCIDMYSQNAFNEIRFGEADTLARAKNISVATMQSSGVLLAQKGLVHIVERENLPEILRPNESIWLLCQQLTHKMEIGGVETCAKAIASIYDSAPERAKDLAYRLFTIAERKGWTQEAYAYNSLVVAWPEIQSRAAEYRASIPQQISMDDLFGN